MDKNHINHCNNDLPVTTEANRENRDKLAYLSRTCMLILIGCLTIMPSHSEGRTITSVKDSMEDMPTLRLEMMSKYFKELIKMSWTEIESKLKKMSKRDSIRLLRTLSVVNDDASSLLDTDIDEKINEKKSPNREQISLFIRLANRYNLPTAIKLRKVLQKNEKLSAQEFDFLMNQYVELCRLIGLNAHKYGNSHSFLSKKGVISDNTDEIEQFVADWEQYIISLEN